SSDASPEPASVLIGHAETILPSCLCLDSIKTRLRPPQPTTNHSTVGVFVQVLSSRTRLTSCSCCTTASAARGCSCSSTRRRFDSRRCRTKMLRCTETSAPLIATCWTAARSTAAVTADTPNY
ncbi:Hypothetical predicted protein, partial [Scomber scombrus]